MGRHELSGALPSSYANSEVLEVLTMITFSLKKKYLKKLFQFPEYEPKLLIGNL